MAKALTVTESDRRIDARTPTHRAAKVLCGTFAWDCLIRDASSEGMRIEMLTGVLPPESLQLIDLAGGLVHDARVQWSKDRSLGLRILRTHDLRGLAPAAVQTAKRIWTASQGRLFAS